MMIKFSNIWIWVPHPPPYKDEAGIEYAQILAKKTQALSLILSILGWLFVILGALLAIGGSVLGSNEQSINSDDLLDELLVHRGLICSTLGVIIAGLGRQLLDRASAATKIASVSTHAILIASSGNNKNKADDDNEGNADKSAYEACVNAKTAWLERRLNNDRLDSIISSLTPKQ